MKHAVRAMAVLALISLAGWARAADDKVVVTYKAKAGEVVRGKSEGTLHMEFGGQKVTMDMKEVEKVTFTTVAPNGDLTMERVTESEEMTINGNKAPSEDPSKDKSTVVIHKDGTLVSYKNSNPESDKDHLAVRLFVASSPIFPETPIGVGDKWSSTTKADSDLGSRAGKADYEVLAAEKKDGVDTLKIKMVYADTEGTPALHSTGTLWIEKATGDAVSGDYDIEGMSMDMGGAQASGTGKIHTERLSGTPIGGGKAATPEAKKEKTIDETVKDYEKLPGFFTLYRKKDSGRETIYLEMKESQLDQLMMLETTASTGTSSQVVAGDPIDDLLFKFVRRADDRILMVVPNYNFRAPAGSPLERAVRRSYADAYIESYKIEAEQKDRKSILINISDLFRGDISQISQRFSGGGGLLARGGGGYSMDRDKTYIMSIKNLPENMVVETAYHFTKGGGGGGGLASLLGGGDVLADPRSIPINVVYTLFPLTDTGYRPRIADPRVGYFLTEFQDYTDDSQDDQHVRYIFRWNLEKQDPKAALSPPKKPIVFWLDNAIPTEYRAAVGDGILRWNKAFEKIGYKDAIVVKQMPDNADWDHADMRYNTIRWVASPNNGYAVALFRVNPMTGQILNANITVDANLVRSIKLERQKAVDPATYFQDPPLTAMSDPRKCDMAGEAMEQAWFGGLAVNMLAAAGQGLDEKAYINSFIRYVVSHEFGHCLGLRHNFVASTYHSLDDLKNEKLLTDSGITASVMDYVAFNISALKHPGVDYWTSTIGPYDMWAIDYGYRPIQATRPEGELPKLRGIASQDNLPGHAYQSDELADTIDPAVVRWDLGSDPLAYWSRNLEVSRYLLLHLGDRLPKKGESYWTFTRDFNTLLGMYARAAATASRYVGGIHINRNFRGDPGEKPTQAPVQAAEQRKALSLLNTCVFSESAFNLPRSYYGKMAADPFGGMDILSMLTGSSSEEFPIRDTIAGVQRAALARLFSPAVLRRVVNNEYKVGDAETALTLPELFHSVNGAVWSELDSGKNVGTLRRQLQRSHLDTMIDLCLKAGGGPDDARMLAWDQLRQLKRRIAADRSRSHDEYTQVHLDESLMRISRALDAKQMLGSQSSSSQSLLQMLLGTDAQKQALAQP